MSLYKIGDVITDELDREGRLVCDGSKVLKEGYPQLVSVLGEVQEDGVGMGYAILPDLAPIKHGDITILPLIQAEAEE